MFILKFFSRQNESGTIPTYRAMACTSYEVSPPWSASGADPTKYATVVMHLLDGSTTDWDLRGNEFLIVENAQGSTIDKIRNPMGPVPEPAFGGIGYGPADAGPLAPGLR